MTCIGEIYETTRSFQIGLFFFRNGMFRGNFVDGKKGVDENGDSWFRKGLKLFVFFQPRGDCGSYAYPR